MVYDRWLFFTAGMLVMVGLLMVGSSSHYLAMSMGKTPHAFLLKQALHLILGLVALVVALQVPYPRLSDPRFVLALVVLSLVGLVVALAMPASGGAHRWIRLGPVGFQPSELAKFVSVVFLASVLARKEGQIDDPWAVPIPCLAVVGVLALLAGIEPDLGGALMLAGIAATMLFAAGLRWRYVLVLAGAGVLGALGAILAEPYRVRRILSYLNPTADLQGSGFQLDQSLIAIGRGGITGVGLGLGQQKAFFLPAAHNDFIFSIVGEELGLAGTAMLLGSFLFLFWRGLRAAVRAPDRFGFFLGLGLTNLLVLQALSNMAVCLGLLPTKGLALPFISYGGSSLVVSMLATGLLLNVSQYSD
jgi:cell division protein FtsW